MHQICPGSPSPTLGLNIDRCINKSKESKQCIDDVESSPLTEEDEVAARTSEFQVLQREQKNLA